MAIDNKSALEVLRELLEPQPQPAANYQFLPPTLMDQESIEEAIRAFEGVDLGIQIPESAEQAFGPAPERIEECDDPACGCHEDAANDVFVCGYCGCRCGTDDSLYVDEYLDALDALSDILTGIEQWKRAKFAGSGWEAEDESLYRWIDGSPHDIIKELKD